MSKKVTARFKKPKGLPLLAAWRKHRDNISQERLAERAGVSNGLISQLERGITNYSQDTLEALAVALQCAPADLLMRNPLDKDAPWSIWEGLQKAPPAERQKILAVVETMLKTGTGG